MRIVYPYIAVDLDGTLLNSHKKIDYVDYYALKLYMSLGGKVILASGRSPLSTEWIAENLSIEKSIVAFNGAFIQYRSEKQYDLIESIFQIEDVEWLLGLCNEFGLEYIMYTHDSMIINDVTPLNKRWLNDLLDFSYLKTNADYSEYLDRFHVIEWNGATEFIDRILKIVVLPNKIEAFEKMFAILQTQDFSLNKTPRYIEITNSIYDKRKALEKVLEETDFSINDIMAIGDNYNDLTMLSAAKLGVVVDNSPLDIKKQIKNIVSNNDNNGVAEAILRYAIK